MRIQLPLQRLEAEFLASQGREDRTAEVRFYSGAAIHRFSYDKGEHELTFDMDGARLGRLNSGRAPLLNAHANYKVSDVIGVVEKGWVEDGQGRARVRFSQRPEVEPILADVRDGILRNISMGTVIHKLKETTAEGEKVRAFLATSWEPYELSVVPVGADPKAMILSADHQQTYECEIEYLQPADAGEGAYLMSEHVITAAAVSNPAVLAERERISRITSLGARWKKPSSFVQEHIDRGTSAEDFGKLILDQAADADGRVTTQSGHSGGGRLFSSLAEQIGAVIEGGRSGGRVDPRLYAVNLASGMSEGVGSEGAFVVQTDFASEILAHVYEVGQIAARCMKIPISANASGIRIPRIDEQSRAEGSRWGGLRSYWLAEAATVSPSKPALGLLALDLKKVVAAVYLTDELIQDGDALVSWLKVVVPQELTYRLEEAIVAGDGIGKPLGLTVSPACIEVSKEGGQAADTFKFENATKMWARYGGTEAGACWLIHRSVIPQLYAMSVVGGLAMAPAFTPTPAAGAPPSSLFGKPIIVTEHCAPIGDRADVILVDLSQYVLIEKGGIETATSIHVKFLEAEQILRFTYRVDGQSAWATAVTPKNGTASLSPWVVLQERT